MLFKPSSSTPEPFPNSGKPPPPFRLPPPSSFHRRQTLRRSFPNSVEPEPSSGRRRARRQGTRRGSKPDRPCRFADRAPSAGLTELDQPRADTSAKLTQSAATQTAQSAKASSVSLSGGPHMSAPHPNF